MGTRLDWANLEEADKVILLAVDRLGKDVTPKAIQDEIFRRKGIDLSVSAVYAALLGLHQRGHIRATRDGSGSRWEADTRDCHREAPSFGGG